ncbi:hypothetical protein V3C99_012974 [Haemonchus contortus]
MLSDWETCVRGRLKDGCSPTEQEQADADEDGLEGRLAWTHRGGRKTDPDGQVLRIGGEGWIAIAEGGRLGRIREEERGGWSGGEGGGEARNVGEKGREHW